MKYSELNEQKKHGTDGFPFEYYHVSEHHPQYEMPLHWHKEFELVHVVNGRLSLHLNGVEYLLKSGDMIAVNSGVLHRGQPEDCVYDCVVFNLDMLKSQSDTVNQLLLPITSGQKWINMFLEADDSILYKTALALFGTARQNEAYKELDIIAKLLAFLTQVYKADLVGNPQSARHDRRLTGLSEFLEWLESNMCERLTLTEMAQHLGLNEKYFCRIFREATGKTPIDHLNFLRINNACHLLIHENMSVTEAAMMCGFSDMSYFSKIFKKYKQCSPRQWIKNITQVQ